MTLQIAGYCVLPDSSKRKTLTLAHEEKVKDQLIKKMESEFSFPDVSPEFSLEKVIIH